MRMRFPVTLGYPILVDWKAFVWTATGASNSVPQHQRPCCCSSRWASGGFKWFASRSEL